jgi:hypothetical protein
MKETSFNRTVQSLCLQIDHLEEEVSYWKNKYIQERNNAIKFENETFEQTKLDLGRILSFTLAVEDDSQGNLIISKENRAKLAEEYK